MGQLEKEFQAKLIKNLKERFKDCIVLKNDPNYIQGIPDLILLYKNKWAALEVKKDSSASIRPNQAYYVTKLNDMSFSAFVYPENVEEVLDDIQRSFEADR